MAFYKNNTNKIWQCFKTFNYYKDGSWKIYFNSVSTKWLSPRFSNQWLRDIKLSQGRMRLVNHYEIHKLIILDYRYILLQKQQILLLKSTPSRRLWERFGKRCPACHFIVMHCSSLNWAGYKSLQMEHAKLICGKWPLFK